MRIPTPLFTFPKMDQLYSVATWDSETQAYTPQKGLSVPSFNITQAQLRQAVRELRFMGYSAHRRRDADGSYDDRDWAVMIERTDGAPEEEIRSGGDVRRSR